MFGVLVVVFFSLFLPYAGARYILGGNDGSRFANMVVLAGLLFLFILFLVDAYFPFAGGGDDEHYYNLSRIEFEFLNQWFDMSYFGAFTSQPGYPMFLTWLTQVSGDSRYALKAANISLFLGTAVIWASIGKTLGGSRIGLTAGVMMLCCTPLWHYWMFLLKDMLIVFLQSAFLFSLINIISGSNIKRNCLLSVISSLFLLLLRIYLVLVNVCLLIGYFFYLFLFRRNELYVFKFIWLILLLIATSMIVYLASDSEFLRAFGIAECRYLDATNYSEMVTKQLEASAYKLNTWLFPIVFLIGESSGLNFESYSNIIDPYLLRGIGQLPWIFFGIPLFLVGCFKLKGLFMVNTNCYRSIEHESFASSNVLRRPDLWVTVLGLIIAYFLISFATSDTTRYRISSYPPMMMVAALGWTSLNYSIRIPILLVYATILLVGTILYYHNRGVI